MGPESATMPRGGTGQNNTADRTRSRVEGSDITIWVSSPPVEWPTTAEGPTDSSRSVQIPGEIGEPDPPDVGDRPAVGAAAQVGGPCVPAAGGRRREPVLEEPGRGPQAVEEHDRASCRTG